MPLRSHMYYLVIFVQHTINKNKQKTCSKFQLYFPPLLGATHTKIKKQSQHQFNHLAVKILIYIFFKIQYLDPIVQHLACYTSFES